MKLSPCVSLIIGLMAVRTLFADWTEISANFPVDFPGYPVLSRMASDGTRLYVAGNGGVYMTQDDGGSFTRLTNVLSSSYTLINTPTFLTYENGYVWVGIDASGASANSDAVALYRLTPGSSDWEKAVDAPVGNLIPGQVGNVIDDLAYDASTGIYYISSGGGANLLTSTNGTTWNENNTGISFTGSVPSTLAASGGVALHGTQNTVASRLYRSGDGGAGWTELSPGFYPSATFEFAANGNIIASSGADPQTNDGLYYSSDSGTSWTKVPITDCGTIDVHIEGDTVFACGHLAYFEFVPVFRNARDNYLAYSTDGGETYNPLDQTGLAQDLAIYEGMVSNGRLYIIGINLSGSGPLKSFYSRPLSELGLGSGGSGLSYAEYAASHYPEGLRGPADDGNTNGIGNGAEFAFGIDDDDPEKLPQAGFGSAADLGLGGTDTYMTLTFRIRKDATGFTFVPRAGTILTNLADGATNVMQVGTALDGGTVDIYTYRSLFTVEATTNGYMDVQLSFE